MCGFYHECYFVRVLFYFHIYCIFSMRYLTYDVIKQRQSYRRHKILNYFNFNLIYVHSLRILYRSNFPPNLWYETCSFPSLSTAVKLRSFSFQYFKLYIYFTLKAKITLQLNSAKKYIFKGSVLFFYIVHWCHKLERNKYILISL